MHHFRYAIVPGASVADAVRHGYQFNLPLRRPWPSGRCEPLVALDNEAVVVEAVKAADDRSGDVVVRCYESLGRSGYDHGESKLRGPGRMAYGPLERPLAKLEVGADNV